MKPRINSRLLAALLLWVGLWVAAIGGPLHLVYHAAPPEQARAAWLAADLDVAADVSCTLCYLAKQSTASSPGRAATPFAGAPRVDVHAFSATALLPSSHSFHAPRAPPTPLLIA